LTLSLSIRRLQIFGFRNIRELDLELSPRVNVFSGDNGQGKTSVLEALYFLSTSRSFRTEKIREVCRDGSESTRVLGIFDEAGIERHQRAVVAAGRRSVFIEDKRAQRLAEYAVRTPVIVFHPGNLSLVSGGAAGRRTMLDRIALFEDPASAAARADYQRALRERQHVLERTPNQTSTLEVFEQLIAKHGAMLQAARAKACQSLTAALEPAFDQMAPTRTRLGVEFRPGGTDDQSRFLAELRQRRERDRHRKAATFGPHRDDVELFLDARAARHHGSQGQQRILTLALKASELECVKRACQTQPILLLDDVSSELDPTRTGAVYDFVQHTESQVLVTTTRPELFHTSGLQAQERADFELTDGGLSSSYRS
jgi:DNA replication and repair protein RecF